MRDLEKPGRSPVHATHGMAATSHPLSTQTAIQVLQEGGNALDAAVAACAVQCVVEPQSTGIGGDCFCLYVPGGQAKSADEIIAFNGSGRAPMAATASWYEDNNISKIERQSPHSVTVPGAVEAWDRLINRHGKKSLGDLLQPAIRYAREGYPIASRVASDFAGNVDIFNADENLGTTFLKGPQQPYERGDIHHQPKLANTLERIADYGRSGFYTGPVAEDMVRYLQSKGGLHTMDDFASVRGDYVTPISTDFRGHRIYQCPPNGQGVIALMLLNIMGGFDVDKEGLLTAERIHQEIEAGRFAYRDRNLYLADPAHADVPVEKLLSAAHADEIRALIGHQTSDTEPALSGTEHKSTVYISVVDKDRNVCSFINTLFDNFGSGLMVPESGVVFQNRGQAFALDPDHPNCIAPGKRPLHTIIPGLVAKDDKIVMPYGVMGGEYQAFGHMQFLTRFFDFGLDIQEAQDAPRFFPDPYSGEVQVEGQISDEVKAELSEKGHKLIKPAKPIGGSQAIWIDWEKGVLTGGSDHRKDGCAIGY